MCTTRSGSVGIADVLEVVVHPGPESEHGLAHVVLVAPGTFNGIDQVVSGGKRRVWRFVGREYGSSGSDLSCALTRPIFLECVLEDGKMGVAVLGEGADEGILQEVIGIASVQEVRF